MKKKLIRTVPITPTIDIQGNKFIKSSSAFFKLPTNDYQLSTVFIDNHHIKATIPKEMLSKAGIFPITVSNPSPEGGTSNSVNITVNNPIPAITALEPAEAMAGTPGLTLNIYGAGFFEETEVYFGGIKKIPAYINNTKLQVALTSEDLKTPGQYEVMAYNSPPGGGNSNKIIFTIKPPLEIKITSPTDGVTINKAKMIVRGTFKSGNQDVGITVNGTIADIKGNEWIANDVPLAIGTNTITAIIKDNTGNTASALISINTTDTSQYVTLSANITSVIPPLQVFFSASTTFTPVSYQMDFEGDGIIDYTGTTFENMSHTYTTEGIFYPTITVADSQGNTYSDMIAITVLNKTEIDILLRAKWEGMKGALAVGDINKAIINFDSASQGIYRNQFTALKPILPDIVNELNTARINMVSIENRIAEYEILVTREGTTFSLHLKFVRDDDGLWKIWSF